MYAFFGTPGLVAPSAIDKLRDGRHDRFSLDVQVVDNPNPVGFDLIHTRLASGF